MKEQDIVYEAGRAWVYRDKRADRYTVFLAGATHSTSDSSYPRTPDGLTLATARADYLAVPRYRVRLTWTERRLPWQPDRIRDYHTVVRAKNVDAAIREAKRLAGAPERATSETQRVED